MISAGQIEPGIAQCDVVGCVYAGTGIFATGGPMENLQAIASLFPEKLQMVIPPDSSIRTLADPKATRISLGQGAPGTIADPRTVCAGQHPQRRI